MSEPAPFLGVLTQCDHGHYEVTTARSFRTATGYVRMCARCGFRLKFIKEAVVVPGRRHSEMPCRRNGRQCVLV